MVDLGSDKVLVVGSNLLTEWVPIRGGSMPTSSHGHKPGPLGPVDLGNCDQCVAVVGEVRIHGVQDNGDAGLSRRASLSLRRPTGQLRA
jgi:hypothetical protein